mmetsp:Transcript_32767/g.63366  ORF Transcript_32767/g.63366 Transcript_32767/m.63366 type:complete len:236 (+) Transcript_32767:72-779(+)
MAASVLAPPEPAAPALPPAPQKKRAAHYLTVDVIAIDHPLRYRRCGYIYSEPPAGEAVPPQLPLRVDEVLAEAEARRARIAEAAKAATTATAIDMVAAESFGQKEVENDLRSDAVGDAVPQAPPDLCLVHFETGEIVMNLPTNGKVLVGRNAGCDLVITGDRFVSGQHCVLHCKEGKVFVEDTSSNQTYLNSRPLLKGREVELEHNDKVSLTRQGHAWIFQSRPSLPASGQRETH